MKKFLLAVVLIFPLSARAPLAQRIIHTDPAKYRPSKAVHEGAGQLDYMPLFDYHDLDTNLFFLHRGIIEPKSGIGHHFHNQCEEMFVIFDGEAQFTIDGRTSLIKGPAGAPCRMGHSHAIYNPTSKPIHRIVDALASLSSDPIKHLINTHWHFDHTDGNEWLHSAGATAAGEQANSSGLTLGGVRFDTYYPMHLNR
jgi:mannose-6-phosphate isomerase-like protein (cupin superfamily)